MPSIRYCVASPSNDRAIAKARCSDRLSTRLVRNICPVQLIRRTFGKSTATVHQCVGLQKQLRQRITRQPVALRIAVGCQAVPIVPY